jgi:hypothetical protein
MGDDRTSVEGLAQRLGSVLGRAAPRLHRIDPVFVAFFLVGPLLVLAFWLGSAVPQWLGGAESDGHWEGWEMVGTVLGVALAVLIPLVLWRAFPSVELLDDGEVSRCRRLRRGVGIALGTLILGVLASWIYDLAR